MSVTLEQIEALRERANVSYAEAKEVLEHCNGDVVEALIMLEGQAKVRARKMDFYDGACKTSKGFFGSVKKVIKKCNVTKFIIRKGDSTIIDIPVTVLVIMFIVTAPLIIAGLLLAMLTGHKITFARPDGGGMKINDTFDKVSTCVNSVSKQVVEVIKE